MKIVGVAACTVGIAHTYMAQKAIQDECAARGIECKVEAQGGLGIENELTQEDVDSADLVLESVDVGVENEDRFEQKMAEGKFLKVGTSDVIADPVKIIDQAIEIIKATGGAVDAPKAEAKAEKKAVSAAPQAPTPASKQSIFADPGKTLLNAFNTGVSYFIPIVVIGGVFLGRKKMPLRIFGMVLGAFIFRLIYTIALRFDMPAFMLKFVSSVIVIAAIATPYFKKQLPLLKRRIQTRSGRRKADA